MNNLSAVRNEMLRANTEPDGRPLPLASCWQGGSYGPTPYIQRELLQSGHYWLPNFGYPLPGSTTGYYAEGGEFRTVFEWLAGEGLPFTLMHTQVEDCLRREVWKGSTWHTLPEDKTGLAFSLDGKIEPQRRVDPLGPMHLWREIGAAFADSEMADWMARVYEAPPRVILLSNNESPKVRWTDFNASKRFVDGYGNDAPYDLRAEVYVRGMRERTQAMNDAFRGALSSAWGEVARFVGYAVAGAPFFGRWSGWRDYISYLPAPLHFCHDLGWQGGSQREIYVGQHDTTTYSPQGQSMQLPFQDAVTDAAQPDWFRESSVWSQVDEYRELNYPGGAFTPDRYLGMMRWLLWIQRPRVLREFQLHATPYAKVRPWLSQVLQAVREVHENDILRRFWRLGKLVPERSRPSPWRYAIPPQLESANRNFLLRTSAEEPWPENVYPTNWVVNAWAMALELDGDYLVYTQSPAEEWRSLRVTLHGGDTVAAPATPRGNFLLVRSDGQMEVVV